MDHWFDRSRATGEPVVTEQPGPSQAAKNFLKLSFRPCIPSPFFSTQVSLIPKDELSNSFFQLSRCSLLIITSQFLYRLPSSQVIIFLLYYQRLVSSFQKQKMNFVSDIAFVKTGIRLHIFSIKETGKKSFCAFSLSFAFLLFVFA